MNNDREFRIIEREIRLPREEPHTEEFRVGNKIYNIVIPPNVAKLVLKLPLR